MPSSVFTMLRSCGLASVTACRFVDGASGGLSTDAGRDIASDATPTTATLFVPDYTMNKLERFALSSDPAPPPPPVTIALTGAESPILLASTGELLVGEYAVSTITRYAMPLGTPTVSGTITGNGLATNFGKMILIDSELWLVEDGVPTGIERIGFSAEGSATMTGSVAVTNPRGLAFDAATRDLYVTQCCGTDTILHFRVATDHSLIAEASLTGNGLNNPHGMWIAPWGELFVADAGAASILRFTRAATGVLTANGTITGNGLDVPLDLVMTPWGELYVANQGNAMVSRFQLDAEHAATANGAFAVPSAGLIGWIALF